MNKLGGKLVLLFVFVFCCGIVAQANAFEIGARAYLWYPDLKKADIQTITDGIKGNDINTKDVLGFGSKATYSVEAYGGVGKNHVSLTFTPFDYSADVVLTNSLTFNGKPLSAGDPVRSDLAFSMFDLRYQRDLINMENILAGFSIGGIAQIKYSTGNLKLNSTATGFEHQQKSFDSFLPMIGVGAHIGLIANLLELRAQGTIGGYGSDNYSYEGLADISLTPFPFLDIHAGYKFIQLKMDVNDYKMDSLYTGPYLAVAVGF
jgi:hypothetical protein